MPEVGRYEKRPRPEHRAFLRQGLSRSAAVSAVTPLDDAHRFLVSRPGMSDVRVYLTNKYILSVADVMEILEADPETTCIVSTMNYNQYSSEAKQWCREQGVGLLLTTELFRVIRHDGLDL